MSSILTGSTSIPLLVDDRDDVDQHGHAAALAAASGFTDELDGFPGNSGWDTALLYGFATDS